MAYSDFTVRRIKQEFGIQTQEGGRFLPPTVDVAPSQMLESILENYVPWAIAVGSEKAKSEMIVAGECVFGAGLHRGCECGVEWDL
jgi:hypothetical protein